jgi:hypothetical protein
MGGPSSNPIRCANQNNERKDPSRGICPGETVKEKNPSRVSVIVVRVGLTSWLMVLLDLGKNRENSNTFSILFTSINLDQHI